MHLQSVSEDAKSAALARSQIIRRLKAAARAARDLRHACDSSATTLSQLQAEAYSAWLDGSVALERGEFISALRNFTISERVYTALAKVSTLEIRALCEERISQLNIYILFCKNRVQNMIEEGIVTQEEVEKQLQAPSTTDISSDESGSESTVESNVESTSMSDATDTNVLASHAAAASEVNEYLRQKFDIVMKESIEKKTTSWRSFQFDGVIIQVPDEQIRIALVTCASLTQALHTALENTAANDVDSSMADTLSHSSTSPTNNENSNVNVIFNKLISTYDQIVLKTKDLLRDIERVKVQSSSVKEQASNLNSLLRYAMFCKLSLTLQRNVDHCFQLCHRFESDVVSNTISKQSSTIPSTTTTTPANKNTYFAIACANILTPSVTSTTTPDAQSQRSLLASNVTSMSSVKVSSLVTLYDRLLQNLEDLLDVLPQTESNNMDDIDDETNGHEQQHQGLTNHYSAKEILVITPENVSTLHARSLLLFRAQIYAALRGYYIALCYIFMQPGLTESYVLLQETKKTFSTILQSLQVVVEYEKSQKDQKSQMKENNTTANNGDSEDNAISSHEKIYDFLDILSFESEYKSISESMDLLGSVLYRLDALMTAKQHYTNVATMNSLQSLSISEDKDQTKKQVISSTNTDTDIVLLDRLDIFSAGRESSNHPAKYRLLDFPPQFITTSIKPFHFDLAGSSLGYVDISHKVKPDPKLANAAKQRAEEEDNKGFWGRIFG